MNFIFSLSPAVGMAFFILGMTALGLCVYTLSRYAMKKMDRISRQFGVYMFRSCGALLGFLLAVNFSAVSTEFSNLREAVDLEVAQLHDLHEDLLRFDTEASRTLANDLIKYSATVLNEEWESLGQGKPSKKAWTQFYRLEDGIIQLEPKSDARRILKSRMLSDVDEISDYRQIRVYSHNQEVVWLRTIVYVMFVLSVFYLGVYAIRPVRLAFVGLYSGAIGLILYSIVAMGHPFAGVAQVSSEPFSLLNEELRAKDY